ncbi:MAG TPA: hypothetical protein VN408_06750 [Actinoplanes sp.]|nr:hypothetical protein [Actinoplanes sp.]
MTRDPDRWVTWGDWEVEAFRIRIARWRDTTHPPADVFELTDRWHKRLYQSVEWRSAAQRVHPDRDPEGNLRWMWVPGAEWIDEATGRFRVQCYFRVYELETPPRLVCDEFVTVPAAYPG